MKDPAALFYISDWLTSTSEMDADCRGWYLNLILHNYDKGDLPNDIEKLAVLAGVKFSEFNRFEQVFKQVLEQKFEKCENNRITNLRTSKIIQAREQFQTKRSNAGKLSYFFKFCYKINAKSMTNKFKEFIKNNIDLDSLDTKNEQMLKQVFEQVFELYRNENENGNKTVIEFEDFKEFWNSNCGNVAKISDFTKSRKDKLQTLLSEYGKDKIIFAIQEVRLSDFLQGKSKDWSCNIDWFLNKSNFVKILEGNYKNKSTQVKPAAYNNDREIKQF